MQIPHRRDYDVTEMQMGPLIDIVFLLLVFFMVTAKPIKPESDISMSLPGTVSQEEALVLPDEVQIHITANGALLLNQMSVATPDDADLAELLNILVRLRLSAESMKTDPLVTIVPDPDCRHQRIVDVLNTAAKAKISGVTFAPVGGQE